MWAEFATEDIRSVATGNSSGELEWISFGGRLIGVNVDMSVVAATGQESTALRPAQSVDTSSVTIQFIHNVQVPDALS